MRLFEFHCWLFLTNQVSPTLPYYQLNPKQHISMKSYSKIKGFHSKRTRYYPGGITLIHSYVLAVIWECDLKQSMFVNKARTAKACPLPSHSWYLRGHLPPKNWGKIPGAKSPTFGSENKWHYSAIINNVKLMIFCFKGRLGLRSQLPVVDDFFRWHWCKRCQI